MNKVIKLFASNSAHRVFRMKKSTKIALGIGAAAAAATAGVIAVKACQAKKQERSIKSLVVEDAIKRLPISSAVPINLEKAMEESSRPYVLPSFARKSIGFTEYDDFDDTFILMPREQFSDFVIFYIHGHNFWSNPSKLHFKFYRKLSDLLGAPLVLPVYPKAPAHHVAEIQEMLLSRYLYLIKEKDVDPQNIIIAGDAAGGGLALSLLQRMKYQALPMPKQAVLLCPWLDLTNTNPDMEEAQKGDPLLKIETLAAQAREYAGDVDLTSPAVSPLYGDMKGLPPISVFCGTHDILSVDSVELERIADEQELDVNVYLFLNQVHFFMGLPIPEAKEALEIIAEEVFGVFDEDDECDDLAEGEDKDGETAPADESPESEDDGAAEDNDSGKAEEE